MAQSSRIGAAIVCATNTNARIENNTFLANMGRAYNLSSAAIVNLSELAVVRNNLIAYNACGLQSLPGTAQNNCFFANELGDFDGVNADGNFVADPCFTSNVFYGDIHLQPQSPCRDAGLAQPDPDRLDIDGEPRVRGSAVDIGADEIADVPPGMTPTIVRVSPDGSDLNDGSSWAAPVLSIQKAIDEAAFQGGEVWVRDGVYIANNLRLRSFAHLFGGFSGSETSRGDRHWSSHETILEMGPNKDGLRRMVVGQLLSRWSTLDGFAARGATNSSKAALELDTCWTTIANNLITSNVSKGPAVILSQRGAPVITNNWIVANETRGGGAAGIFCVSQSVPALLVNNIVSSNRTSGSGFWGRLATGGIGFDGAAPILIGNIVADNLTTNATSGVIGAGLCFVACTNVRVINNTILRNRAITNEVVPPGAGLTVYNSHGLDFINNIVVSNASGLHVEQSTLGLSNNCIFGNGPLEFVGIPDPTGQNGNLCVDPQLGGADGFHLVTGSPCIDAGANDAGVLAAWDFDGEARLHGAFVDIGADEAPVGPGWRPAFQPPMGTAELSLTNVGGLTYAFLDVPLPHTGYQIFASGPPVLSSGRIELDFRILETDGVTEPTLQTNRSVAVLGLLPAGDYGVTLSLWGTAITTQGWTAVDSRDATLVDAGLDGLGAHRFTVLGVPAVDYRIQTSTDLTNWIGIYTNRGAPFTYTNSASSASDTQFYRVSVTAAP